MHLIFHTSNPSPLLPFTQISTSLYTPATGAEVRRSPETPSFSPIKHHHHPPPPFFALTPGRPPPFCENRTFFTVYFLTPPLYLIR
ncbi:hypothetical protein HanXRQr2_Chr09g0381851 [Helianthus annuus]|uniref:Uncharacterized protein n=1 Tax=Helianthus annuus TaxID=4232 RepID=A0A251TSW9_HELAN|nr:hypothetical protein HanXRQr2_Chr09g0381841 [Helianthus annuus]KAF5790325.1 hypothetical protein HanXRQr2_Chr09g0381851 [Helianthus annuus]KAJ0533707.1 hypothetical protein HanIR_Chr09g0411491 [Helianthus annuus]